MSDIAIRVENLSKRYRLGVKEEKQDTLVGSVLAMLKRPGQNLQRLRRLTRFADNGADEKDAMWALKDVSFEVKQGEVVGVIGRNGAGKSTLLKILSRITYPTAGRVELHGRVSSLLEVGTGFHPELTGRENIYLNGTILGMRKAEIDRKFDEIVNFSGIEKFIDTPVKRYSSGMGVRLAFSVSAHLEPEILIIDEVLAVGDDEFQKKCLGKLDDVAKDGRTIIFVSHNMSAVQRLCTRCSLLEMGKLAAEGDVTAIVHEYLNVFSQNKKWDDPIFDNGDYQIITRVFDERGNLTKLWRYGEKLTIEVTVIAKIPIHEPIVDIGFYSGRVRLFALQSNKLGNGPEIIQGKSSISFVIDNPGFTTNEMHFDVGLRQKNGTYFILVAEAGRISSDHDTTPAVAPDNCLIYPKVTHLWK